MLPFFPGVLTISEIKCRDLAAMDSSRSSDPFVKFQIMGQKVLALVVVGNRGFLFLSFLSPFSWLLLT